MDSRIKDMRYGAYTCKCGRLVGRNARSNHEVFCANVPRPEPIARYYFDNCISMADLARHFDMPPGNGLKRHLQHGLLVLFGMSDDDSETFIKNRSDMIRASHNSRPRTLAERTSTSAPLWPKCKPCKIKLSENDIASGLTSCAVCRGIEPVDIHGRTVKISS